MTYLVTMVTAMTSWLGEVPVQTVQAPEFKAKCLALMDGVASTGDVLVITRNGKPIAELRPYSGDKVDSPFGLHRRLAILGDVVSPIEDARAWSWPGASAPAPGAAWT